MTFRERIADWISGGNYSFSVALMVDRHNLAAKRLDQLNRIAACETPKASHTVRKMAAIAREGLE